MAGQPKKKTDLVTLDSVGADKVSELLEQGKALTDICKALGVGKKALNEWLEAPERAGLLTRARTRAADQLAAETLAIADSAGPDEVQQARLRTDVRKWLASKWAPGLYGDTKAGVTINLNTLHGESLRRAQVIETIDIQPD